MLRRPTIAAMAVTAGLALAALGCGDHFHGPTQVDPLKRLASCGSAPVLTVPLVPFDHISSIAPLGNVGPPGHTFPTDHIYVYMTTIAVISAPAASILASVAVSHRTGGGLAPVDDYDLTFYPCADLQLQLGHVARLAAQLSAKVGALTESCGPTYQTGGFTYQQCGKQVDIDLVAGQAIGTSAISLDVYARDRRVALTYVNPTRLNDPTGTFGDVHAACPIDYYVSSIADEWRSKLGPPGLIRTTPPVCGEIMQDVPNSAAGRWFFPGSPLSPEDPHLALIHNNVQPELALFSVGTSIPSIPSAGYTFIPATSGRENLDFRYVTTVGEIECYSLFANRRVLLQLVSTSRLRIEGISPGPCGDPPTWAFSTAAVEFER
jgi:hypothetical protein